MDNQNQIFKVVEQGFHVTLGAISVATETLQNEQKRSQLVLELNEQFNQRAQEWEEKGEATATEARQFIEKLVNQDSSQTKTTQPSNTVGGETANGNQSSKTTEPAADDFPGRLQSLTDEVRTLREEMAQFRS